MTIVPLAKGFNDAYLFGVTRAEENIVRQGRSKQAALLQFYQVEKAISIFNDSLAVQGKAALSLPIKVVCRLAPFLVTWCASKGFANHRIRKIVNFAHDHLSVIAQAITFISIAILFLNGHVLYASAYIGWSAVAALLKTSLIPETVKAKIRNTGLIVGCCTGFLIGDWLDKIVSTVIIIDELSKKFSTKKAVKNFDSVREEMESKELPSLTYEKILSLSLDNVAINHKHMRKEILPRIPSETNPEELIKLFEEIPWENYDAQIAVKLSGDRRWQQVSSGELSPQQYVRKELHNLIVGIANKSIKVGPPSNYGRLQYYLKYITFRLMSEKPKLLEEAKKLSESELKKIDSEKSAWEHLCVDSLLHLAVGGGTYCGLGEFQAVANVFYSLIARDRTLLLKDRFYVILQIERQQLMDSIYYRMWNSNRCYKLLGWLIDWDDVHTRSYYYALLIDKIGLMQDGSKEEVRDTFTELLSSFIAAVWARFFKIKYSHQFIIRAFYDLEGSPLLPKPDLANWWLEWTQKNHRPVLQATLADSPSSLGELPFNEDVTIDEKNYSSRLNQNLLLAMLYEMEIFKDKRAYA